MYHITLGSITHHLLHSSLFHLHSFDVAVFLVLGHHGQEQPGDVAAQHQGLAYLTLVHFSAQLKHFSWNELGVVSVTNR